MSEFEGEAPQSAPNTQETIVSQQPEKPVGPQVEAFTSGKDKEGLRLDVNERCRVSVIKQKSWDPSTGQTSYAGVEGGFLVRDNEGEMKFEPGSAFVLNEETAPEGVLPDLLKAFGTMITVGAKPKEVADFIYDIQARKMRELIEARQQLHTS